jgi:hypothetical protein
MATERIPLRERRPSVGVPIVDIQGSVAPEGISRPKHKRTFTGFGAGEIKSVEGMSNVSDFTPEFCSWARYRLGVTGHGLQFVVSARDKVTPRGLNEGLSVSAVTVANIHLSSFDPRATA